MLVSEDAGTGVRFFSFKLLYLYYYIIIEIHVQV